MSVWKLKFWASVIIWEYIWTFCKYLEFGNIVIYHLCFTSQSFCFHFLSESSKGGSVLGANLLIELLCWEVNQGLQSVKFTTSYFFSRHSINLLYGHALNTVVISGLVLLAATWNFWISYKNSMQGCWSFPCCLSWTLGSSSKSSQLTVSLFYRHYFGRCSYEPAQLVPLPYSQGRSTLYSDRLHDFSVTIPRCCMDVYVNSFFPRTVRLWTYDSFDLRFKWF